MTQPLMATETEISALFQAQKKNLAGIAATTAKERMVKIRKVMDWMLANQERIAEALSADYGKHRVEVKISEVMPVISEGKHIIKHLAQWMRPESVETPLKMLGTTSKIVHEPKGNCLIVSPWNYPFNLTLKPLLQAIAAGNAVIIKPSELVPESSKLIAEMIKTLFLADEITVVEGDATVATVLLSMPFNHIFFTGSPAIGKVVMQAAARHLASVTLELGGKSPTIIDETADIKKAAQTITAEKFLNNGQTCIAPDYILIHKSQTARFIEEADKYIKKMYGDDVAKSVDYCRIVNARHFSRIKSLIDDAVSKGAIIAVGGNSIAAENYIEPTLVSNVNPAMEVMQQEIFGPVLPILEFESHEEAVRYINAGEKPLALYIFSKKRANIDYFQNNTSSGAVVINETTIHYLQNNLPFGGVNNSGIGKSSGKYGFEEFSNKKAVVENKFSTFGMFHPPYTSRIEKMIDMVIKWL
ncbi:aldehyde dehydrogenase family protein [Emticicia sp. TH156]|uniref:aldehyde dehydrogenase family protein n=1 Tax=Emticicia sp. TH156 TaxID=2067454 RepID=UPI000C780F5A|nr:aldehyde dehydrogenase family protein [Emticicia sp. TH156]PLK43685.1 aldehyde dehydrogenase family protein [Emticicia sp. TH156]